MNASSRAIILKKNGQIWMHVADRQGSTVFVIPCPDHTCSHDEFRDLCARFFPEWTCMIEGIRHE